MLINVQRLYENCTDCLLKQIIEKCQQQINKKTKDLAKNILLDSDIEELKKATLQELIMLVENDNSHKQCYEDVHQLFKDKQIDE